MTHARTARTVADAVMADADHARPPPETEVTDGRPAVSVAHDFARLRTRLLALVDGLADQDDAEIGAIRAEMGLSDRAFGELWAACRCNGDLGPGRRRRRG
jgi:hypothetical protein